METNRQTTEFIHVIKVRWADCDPAEIAYTGRVANFVLEAIDAWWEEHSGSGWYQLNIDHNIGLPFVHMSIDFISPVTPRHLLECKVRLIKLGTNSIRFEVRGRQEGNNCFTGQFVEAYVEAKGRIKAPMPKDFREMLSNKVEEDAA